MTIRPKMNDKEHRKHDFQPVNESMLVISCKLPALNPQTLHTNTTHQHVTAGNRDRPVPYARYRSRCTHWQRHKATLETASSGSIRGVHAIQRTFWSEHCFSMHLPIPADRATMYNASWCNTKLHGMECIDSIFIIGSFVTTSWDHINIYLVSQAKKSLNAKGEEIDF